MKTLLTAALALAPLVAQDQFAPARNEAVELTVAAIRKADRYGIVAAPQDRKFLVVATEWRNLIPTTEVDGKLLPTPYLVPELDKQLFLIFDGGHVAAFAQGTSGRPGVLPKKGFKVTEAQVPTRGNLVFEVPAATSDLVLAFLDDRHGAFAIRLEGDATPPKILAGPGKNELLEAFVTAVSASPDANQPDVETLAVDVRFKSLWQPDPKAKCASLVRWPGWHDYVQLIVDGERALAASASPFDKDATILPEVVTGGEFRFRVPKVRKSLELALYFAEVPTQKGRVRPKPIVLPVEGKREAPGARAALVAWEDAFFACKVLERRPGAVLTIEIKNVGKTWEVFQPFEQIALVDPTGSKATPTLDATQRLPFGAGKQMLVPPGETRVFELAYPVDPQTARLMFASADPKGSKVLALPVLAGAEGTPPVAKPPDPGTEPAVPIKTQPERPVDPGPVVTKKEPEKPVAPPARPGRKPLETLVIAGKSFPARVPVRSDATPKGIAGQGITPEQVNAAIDRGAAALWSHMTGGKSKRLEFGNYGPWILSALALVHAHYHEKNADFDASVREFLRRREPIDDTYMNGLIAMMITAYGSTEALPLQRACSEWLVNTQLANGSWTYRQPTTKGLPPFFTKLPDPPAATTLRVEGGTDPMANGPKLVERAGTMPRHESSGDNSVTQYALLGLDASHRCALPVAPSVWQSVLELALARQAVDGGWDYTEGNGNTYGSMTAAGVCAVALANHYLGKVNEGDPAIERGLAWLAARFDLASHPGLGVNWQYYWLYSLERVGRFLDTEFIGPHEWYPLGVKSLLGAQTANGLWRTGNEDEVLATSFALLFLTRATPSLNAATLSGPGRLVTSVAQPKGRKLYIVLDASGSMLEEIGGKTKFDLARNAVTSLLAVLPPETEVALRVYGHRKRAIEPGADEDCELVLPMARLDLPKFQQRLQALRSRGKTPLARSLEQAAGEVTGGTADMPLTLLLLTDGGEDTFPRRDPVAAAKKLASVKNLRFKIVGFDINRDNWKTQLVAMAEAGGGAYLPATTGEALADQLRFAALEMPSRFRVLGANGATVASGAFGETVTLPAGEYAFETELGAETLKTKLSIRPQNATRVVYDANAPRSR